MPITLESPEITQTDYRALREGRDVPEKLSEATPAVKPGEAETATEPESVDTPEDQPKETEKPKSPPKRGMVDEIVKLRNANRELQARLETPKLPSPPSSSAEAKPAAPVAVSIPAEDPEPAQEKYTDYGLYTKDLIKWTYRQESRQAAAENARVEQERAAITKATSWNERVKLATSEKPDFQAVALNVDLPISRAMGDAITDSELGAEILYHLGSNPDEAARISKLSPVAQIREIGKLEVTLAKAPADDEDENPPTKLTVVSKAPAPISKPAGGSASRSNPLKQIDSMTQAEYRAYRESGKL